MIVIPSDEFMMGSPASENGHNDDEYPPHKVEIAKRFAVAKFELMFEEWDACASYGDCDPRIKDAWGRGRRPVINVSWDDAERYVVWLSRMTGKPYRLLTEAEWEYAARAKTTSVYYWGDEIGKGNANCRGCGSPWDGKQRTAPVGSFAPNAFGLYDMAGNVYQWLQDCKNNTYYGAPTDGSPWTSGDCGHRVVRGSSWFMDPPWVRSAKRFQFAPSFRIDSLGFRVARTLNSGARGASK
jgi:formylglycine-generating enzyme required for sulfatase activity